MVAYNWIQDLKRGSKEVARNFPLVRAQIPAGGLGGAL